VLARFGTAINCIDGRVQEPVTRWLKETYLLDYVDMVTEPGPDAALASGSAEAVEALRAKVAVSLTAHGSNVVAIAGHHDCAGNLVSREEHLEQIRRAMQAIRLWGFATTVAGLWVDEAWSVEVVTG
jgi:hypothetical protein